MRAGVRVLVVIAAVSSVAACGARSSSGTGRAGLYGTVRLSPATPTCRKGVPCSRPAAGLELRFVRNGRTATVTTDRRGRYRIGLAPGRYLVRAVARRGVRPGVATVPPGRFARRNFTYDAGIR